MAKYTGLKDETLYDDMIIPYPEPDGQINKQLLADDIQWFVDNKLMQAKVDVNQIVDMQYVDYAISRLGKYR